MAKNKAKQSIRIVKDWSPEAVQEQLDNLCDDGYTLHTILNLPNNQIYVVMVKDL